MEKKYNTLIFLFVAFLFISLAGFYRSYFQYFPYFKNTTPFTHIHFVIFLSWFAVLIWQPILIKQKNFALHRKVGRISYFLAPAMVISILVIVKLNIANNLTLSGGQAAVAAAGAVLDAVFFSVFYIAGVVNRHKIRRHVAFLVGASLIVLNPGLGRLVSNMFHQDIGVPAMAITPYLVAISIIVYEKFKLKRALLNSPYLFIILFWTLELVFFVVLSSAGFWKEFVVKVAAI